jgi:hypothetical protein
MPKLEILVCGDSFAASKDPVSWTAHLKKEHNVVQHGWKGCGEYKIYQQITMQCRDHFDLTIVSHTSSTRLHTATHPLYVDPHEHKHADLIFSDIIDRRHSHPVIETAVRYFEQIFDIEYYDFLHGLMLEKINNELISGKSLHLFPLYLPNNIPFEHWMDIRNIMIDNPGESNHYDADGNDKVFKMISQWIQKNY